MQFSAAFMNNRPTGARGGSTASFRDAVTLPGIQLTFVSETNVIVKCYVSLLALCREGFLVGAVWCPD